MFRIQNNSNLLIVGLSVLLFFFLQSNSYPYDISNFSTDSTKSGYQLYEVATYMGFTGQEIGVAWDANPEPDIEGYDIRVYLVEQDRFILSEQHVSATTTKFQYIPNVSGHYVFEIRAVDLAGQKSDWTSSIDKNRASVNGKKEGWWIYVHIAPPSDEITFE